MDERAVVPVGHVSTVLSNKSCSDERGALMQIFIESRQRYTKQQSDAIDKAKIGVQESGAANKVDEMLLANFEVEQLELGGKKREFTVRTLGHTRILTEEIRCDPCMIFPPECLLFPTHESNLSSSQTYILGERGFTPTSELQLDQMCLVLTPLDEYFEMEKEKKRTDPEVNSLLFATFQVLVPEKTIQFRESKKSCGSARPVLSNHIFYPSESRVKGDFEMHAHQLKSNEFFLNSLEKKRKKTDIPKYSIDDLLFLSLPDLLQLCSLVYISGNSASSADILSLTSESHVQKMCDELQETLKESSCYNVKKGFFDSCDKCPKHFAKLELSDPLAVGTIVIPLGTMVKTSPVDSIVHQQKKVQLQTLFPGLRKWRVYQLTTSVYARGKPCETAHCYFSLTEKYATSFKSPKFSDDPNGIVLSNHDYRGSFMLVPEFQIDGNKLPENKGWNRMIEKAQCIVRCGKYTMSLHEFQECFVEGGTGLAGHIADSAKKKMKPILEGQSLLPFNRIEDLQKPAWSVLPPTSSDYIEMCKKPVTLEKILSSINYALDCQSMPNPLCIDTRLLLSLSDTPKLNPEESCVLELLRCLISTPFLPCGFNFQLDEFMKCLLENILFREKDFATKCVFYTDVAAIIGIFLHIVYHSTDCSLYCPFDIDVQSLGRDNLVSFMGNLCTKAYPWMKDCQFGNRNEFITSCFPLVNQALATLCHMDTIQAVDTDEYFETLRVYVRDISSETVQHYIDCFRKKIREYQQNIYALKESLHLADFEGSHVKFMDKLRKSKFLGYTFEILGQKLNIEPEASSEEEEEDI